MPVSCSCLLYTSQAGYVSVEARIHLHLVRIELQLGRIEQRLIGGETGDNFVHRLDEVDNIYHRPVRHGGGDISGNSVHQRGADVGVGKLLLPGEMCLRDRLKAVDEVVAELFDELLLPITSGLEPAEEESQRARLLDPTQAADEVAVFVQPGYAVDGVEHLAHREHAPRHGQTQQFHVRYRLRAVRLALLDVYKRQGSGFV